MPTPIDDRSGSATPPSVSDTGPWSAARAFWWLLAAGALAGALGEAGVIIGGRLVLHRYALFNPQAVWLAPIANALLLVVPFGVVWVIARRRSAATAIVAVAFCAALAAVIEPLIVLGERLHPLALFVLAVGVAAQVARFARARPPLFARMARGLTLLLLAVSITTGVGFNVLRALRERAALAALGGASDGAPNVLLLVLDTVRAMSLSAYGYNRNTSPFLAELAARGVRFDQAIASAPWTLPSHATMFTGRYPHELSAGWSTPLDGRAPTLAERLSQQGYATLGVAANLHYVSYEFGLTRGFARFRDYDVSVSEMLRTSKLTHSAVRAINLLGGREISPGRQTAARVSERLLDLLDARGNHPFFAFANYYDAHGPYNPAAPYDTMFLGRQSAYRDPGENQLSASATTDLLAAYDASIAELDAQLRELFRALDARGLLANTLIIVTSDHGEEFNEHGQFNHGSTLYLPSVHVPLLMIQPGVIPPGLVVPSAVTLRDIPHTILDVAKAPASAQLPGASLALWWRAAAASVGVAAPAPASPAPASRVLSELDYARNLPANTAIAKGDMRSEIVDAFRFILNGDGRGELYDLRRDLLENRDLIAVPEHAARAASLRQGVLGIPRNTSPSK